MPHLADIEVTPSSELPDITFTWPALASSTHTLAVRVAERGSTTDLALSITATHTGEDVTIVVAEGALSSLSVGTTYDVQVWATRQSDSKEREPARFRMKCVRRIGSNL